MAGRKEPGADHGRTDAPRAVVTAFPSRRDVSMQLRDLARDFDVIAGRVQHERGFDQRRLLFAVRFQGLTQTHIDGIAAFFGTTVVQSQSMGTKEQTITAPVTGDSIKFLLRGNEGRRDRSLGPYLALIHAQQKGESEKKFHQIIAADERGRRDIAVVLGPDSVSFVQDPHVSLRSAAEPDAPSIYLITTLTPDGFNPTADYDYKLLRDPIHRLNLAKGIIHLDPDYI